MTRDRRQINLRLTDGEWVELDELVARVRAEAGLMLRWIDIFRFGVEGLKKKYPPPPDQDIKPQKRSKQ